MSNSAFITATEISVDPRRACVHEAGWQSWSPEGTYAADVTSPRPVRRVHQTMAFRPERPAPETGFQGEGLLAVDPGDGGPVVLIAGADLPLLVPSIRAQLKGDTLIVSADGPVRVELAAGPLSAALDGWAASVAATAAVEAPLSIPAVWCSWYCYWRDVTADDVMRNDADARRLGIDIGVVQIDDGWQAAIGDWDRDSRRFGSLERTVGELRDRSRAVGLWMAPFLVVEGSELARAHPDWLVTGVDAGWNWESRLRVLDTTNPDAAEYLAACVRRAVAAGVTYLKLDFLYAGAMAGPRHSDEHPLVAYRDALAFIRDAAGPGVTVLGCGAPLLPSVGLVDAMRISPDVMPTWEPPDGDVSQPGGHAAMLAGAARTHLHQRWWVNDPDCLLARPGVERRERWAEHLRAVGGLASCSDPLGALDDWGLTVTRELMRPTS